jgi:hypothetical protein
VIELSNAQARRIALRAQQFGVSRISAPRLIERLGAIQIDAVNVLVRSHYLPIYSRLGSYDVSAFDRAAYKNAFEYLGHQAAFVPMSLQPAFRWRMAEYSHNKHWVSGQERIRRERPGYVETVMREIADRGPLAFTELADPARREKVPAKYAESSLLWYRWSDGKSLLEGLFNSGQLAVAGRRGFERRYDLPERVFPAAVLDAPTPDVADAQRQLVLHASRALGVATVRDVADYFRLPMAVTRARLRELVDAAELEPAVVEGWPEPAFVVPGASDRRVSCAALLSPFDSLLWERSRVQRLFGFTHSFELYVKPEKRIYGYYVLPFLFEENLVGRVDLKADRASGRLLALCTFLEPGTPRHKEIRSALRQALNDMAAWLQLDRVEIAKRGNLF